MKEIRKKNSTSELIRKLRKTGNATEENLWKKLAGRLSKPSRKEKNVNIEKIALMTGKNKGKILVVPGKVLGKGEIEEAVTIAAFSFSETALAKIEAAKGKTMTLNELIESKTKAKEMIIVL